ncbi:hypothetical protein LTR84_003112 [Exophiala bonariae]|uniref:Extracellular membrane protein CFEM domain-containing protein n=1 Tax=Exophiala bonariae TaxID=1690606 RepID=A0AAV9N820_9EURO|nr:hypothetical protein LTR84_003112 [Exophiala bonariae]
MAWSTPTLRLLMIYLPFLLHLAHSQTTSADYCQALVDVLSICQLETSGFTALPFTQQQSCYCADTLGTLAWGPSTFDNIASLCASQYATIDVTIASDARVLEGFCTDYVPASQTSVAPQSSVASLTGAGVVATATPQNTIPSTFASVTSVAGGAGSGALTSAGPTPNSPGTEISVLTVTQTSVPISSKNAAVGGMCCPGMQVVGYDVAFGAVVLGGYLVA